MTASSFDLHHPSLSVTSLLAAFKRVGSSKGKKCICITREGFRAKDRDSLLVTAEKAVILTDAILSDYVSIYAANAELQLHLTSLFSIVNPNLSSQVMSKIRKGPYWRDIEKKDAQKELIGCSPGTFMIRPDDDFNGLLCASVVDSDGAVQHLKFEVTREGKINQQIEHQYTMEVILIDYESYLHFVRSKVPKLIELHSDNQIDNLIGQFEWNVTRSSVSKTLEGKNRGAACLTHGDREGDYLIHINNGDSIDIYRVAIHNEKVEAIVEEERIEANSLFELLWQKLNLEFPLNFLQDFPKLSEELEQSRLYFQKTLPEMVKDKINGTDL